MISDYIFTNLVIMRSPVYSFGEYHGVQGLETVLNDPYFRSAIAVASKGLFRELTLAEFQFNRLQAKARLALHRYYNRMCYRPTPFGLFAGITAIEWNTADRIRLGPDYKIHSFPDFKTVSLADQVARESSPDVIRYVLNTSLYSFNTEYRYLAYTDNADQKRVFSLHQMERSVEMDKFFSFLRSERPRMAIIEYLMKIADFNELDAKLFFLQLAEEQIILPSLLATTNGADRSGCVIVSRDNTIVNDIENERYVNLEVIAENGTLDKTYQDVIMDALTAIDRFVPLQEPTDIAAFIRAFVQRYDRQMVLLLEALDPEKGVGYGGLMDDLETIDRLKDVRLEERKDTAQMLRWTAAHTCLMEHWHQMPSGTDPVIRLDKEKINQLPLANDLYPPSMSVLFRLADEGIYIEQAGGACASALAGRFTLFQDEIWLNQVNVSRAEQRDNPDAIIAEVSHISHLHTANIDRRRHIYNYEISVLTGSLLDKDKQIALNDLWVCVDNGAIILWSKRLNQRIIPRLSSAFNYKRDELPVFRFLCDLQHHQVKTNFHFDLKDFFPGLKYYPRVQIGKAILQLASWHLDENDLKFVLAIKENEMAIQLLKDWQRRFQWPQYISLDDYDNQLVFDTLDDDSLTFLLDNLKSVKTATIREFPFCSQSSAIGNDGKPHINQFVATIYHTNSVYQNRKENSQLACNHQRIIRKYMTGSQWLYLKIYCHYSKANELLISRLMPFLQTEETKQMVRKWFFIRYRDPQYHLRLRFNIAPTDAGRMIELFTKTFSGEIENGLITDFQYNIYDRELERYSEVLIEETEQIFCESSCLVLVYLNNYLSEGIKADDRFILDCIEVMTDTFGLTDEAKAAMFQQLYLSLYAGFTKSKSTNEQLKQKYRDFQKIILAANNCNNYEAEFMAFKKVLDKTARKVVHWNDQERVALLSDLVHMHLNRLLPDHQRKQELIIYYCLYKHYFSENARRIKSNFSLSAMTSG